MADFKSVPMSGNCLNNWGVSEAVRKTTINEQMNLIT